MDFWQWETSRGVGTVVDCGGLWRTEVDWGTGREDGTLETVRQQREAGRGGAGRGGAGRGLRGPTGPGLRGEVRPSVWETGMETNTGSRSSREDLNCSALIVATRNYFCLLTCECDSALRSPLPLLRAHPSHHGGKLTTESGEFGMIPTQNKMSRPADHGILFLYACKAGMPKQPEPQREPDLLPGAGAVVIFYLEPES